MATIYDFKTGKMLNEAPQETPEQAITKLIQENPSLAVQQFLQYYTGFNAMNGFVQNIYRSMKLNPNVSIEEVLSVFEQFMGLEENENPEAE